MIYGDPFYFALQFDTVKSWNTSDDFWNNGLFSLYINGQRVFHTVDVFELKTIFGFYANSPINSLYINDLYFLSTDLYRNAENYFTGEATELINGLFDLTCTAMEDNHCYLYFLKTGKGDRLVWSTDNGITINEILLSSGTILSVINELKNCLL